MALLHYMRAVSDRLQLKIIALNVEHGIRGKTSLEDTAFVKNYCAEHGVPLLTYSVDSLAEAEKSGLSVEEAARKLRYQCFFDAINKGACDYVATAHHAADNAESVLFNLLRGSGLKGLTGIKEIFEGKIIRPLLRTSKAQIEEYLTENAVPFVTDETNLDGNYTRNYLRLTVMPAIKRTFPEAEVSICRFAEIAKAEDEYLDECAKKRLVYESDVVKLGVDCPPALFSRACVLAMRSMGINKDWTKEHIDALLSLKEKENGARVSLKAGVSAIKEYGNIVFFREKSVTDKSCDGQNAKAALPFSVGLLTINGKCVKIEYVTSPDPLDLKSGCYADYDKIPQTAVIRRRMQGDVFNKYGKGERGGGSKPLNDYLTDVKHPLRTRDELLLLADGNEVLVIFGLAVSNKVKVDDNTKKIIKLS